MDIEIDMSALERFLTEFPKATGIVDDELRDAMDAGLIALETVAVDETPVGATGNARQSIQRVVEGQSAGLEGRLVMGAPYGLPLEDGRKAGKWPPRAAIAVWVRRKLQVPPDRVESVAFLIQRAIGTRGTRPGARMFATAFERQQGTVIRLFEAVPGRAVLRLAGEL